MTIKIGTNLPNIYKLRVKKDGFHSSSDYCKNLKIVNLGLEEDIGELRTKIWIYWQSVTKYLANNNNNNNNNKNRKTWLEMKTLISAFA